MPKTDLKIKSINANSGAKINTTVSYVNGSASSGALKTYAQLLNGLTNNIYSETDRIQTINVDTEAVPIPASKQIPTLSIGTPTVTSSTELNVPYSYDGDGTLQAVILYKQGGSSTVSYKTTTVDTTNHVVKSECYYGSSYDYYFYLVAEETSAFYSAGIYQLIRFS